MSDITVLMSVYNGEEWLKGAINSILGQSEDDFEFIIINDGSTDNTSMILESYDDKRLLIVNQENMGLTKSLNIGLQLAKGKYIARIDADDQADPDRLKIQKQFLNDNPDIVLAGSNVLLIDETDEDIGKTNFPLSYSTIKTHLETFKPVFVHSSFFFRKKEIIQIGAYNERFTKSQDFDLILRLSQSFKLANLKEPLVKLRMTIDSMSYCCDNLQKKMGLAAIINHYRRKMGLEDFTVASESQWQAFLRELDVWFDEKEFGRKAEAKKWFRNFRTLIWKKKYSLAVKSLYLSFRNDPFFWAYKDIGIKIPKDLLKFMSSN